MGSDKEGTLSDVHLMTHSSKKNQTLDEQIISLPSQRSWDGMLGTTLDYLAQTGPPAYSWPPKIKPFALLQSFRLWISNITTLNTSPLCRYYTRAGLSPAGGPVVPCPVPPISRLAPVCYIHPILYFLNVAPPGFWPLLLVLSPPLLNPGDGLALVPPFWSGTCLAREEVLIEGCNSLIYWVQQPCPLKPLLERSWRHSYGPRLCNITDFYHYAIHPLKNFYTPLSGAPQKCFKSDPAFANASPARIVIILSTNVRSDFLR